MGKLQEFFMQGTAAEPVTAEVAVAGLPHPFLVQSIDQDENTAIKRSCQKVAFDKRTHQKTTEIDQDMYNLRLVAACCVDPNSKDADLQKQYGVMGAEALIGKVLKPGQFIDLLIGVQEVNGFAEDPNELRDEAKN